MDEVLRLVRLTKPYPMFPNWAIPADTLLEVVREEGDVLTVREQDRPRLIAMRREWVAELPDQSGD